MAAITMLHVVTFRDFDNPSKAISVRNVKLHWQWSRIGIFAEFTWQQMQTLVLSRFHYTVRTAAIAAVKYGRHRITTLAALIYVVTL